MQLFDYRDFSIEIISDHGIYPDNELTYFVDMKTGMKSHLHLIQNSSGVWVAKTRYDADEQIENLEDLLFAIKGCFCGREFGSDIWVKILEDQNLIQTKVETTTRIIL